MAIKQQTHNIVVVGDHTPSIFNPNWFVNQKLLSEDEALSGETDIKVVHPDVTQINFPTFDLRVERNKFIAATNRDDFLEPLRDIVKSVFGLLKHTPVVALGINYIQHIELQEKTFDDILTKFYTPDFWNGKVSSAFLEDISFNLNKKVIEDHQRYTRIKLRRIDNVSNEFILDYNHHFGYDRPRDGRFISQLLTQEWESTSESTATLTPQICS